MDQPILELLFANADLEVKVHDLTKFLKKILKRSTRNPSEIKKRQEWKSSIKFSEIFRREFRKSLAKRIMKHITISGLHTKKWALSVRQVMNFSFHFEGQSDLSILAV
jgi:hypothetical protein